MARRLPFYRNESDLGTLDTGGFFKDHLHLIFEVHVFEGLLPLHRLDLVELVQVLHFLAAFVLLLEVVHVALDLLLALLDADSDLASDLFLFVFFLLFDFV